MGTDSQAGEPVQSRPQLPPSLRGLLRPEAYPHAVAGIELIETQLSWVLVAGERVYKLKRPVQYAFVDQRQLSQRAHLCHEELRLNRRFSPQLYLDVCAITAEGGVARVGGGGPPIEYAVVLKAFDRREQLDQLVRDRRLRPGEIERFGAWLAMAQHGLPSVPASPVTPSSISAAMLANARDCLAAGGVFGTGALCRPILAALSAELARQMPALARRVEGGCIRECHADLHLSNVVRVGGELRPFDCLEFDPALRCIDTALDAAFLHADLLGYGEPGIATRYLDAYLSSSGDYRSCRLLPLYVTDRALVRAKVLALQGCASVDPAPDVLLRERHLRYLAVAETALQPRTPRCLLMTGLPGSGKSWLAARLAEHVGAVVVRADVERKRLAGLDPRASSRAAGAADLYSARCTQQVYEHLARCATEVLAGSRDVIVDANFGKRWQRQHLSGVCRSLGVPLTVLHCEAPWALLQQRIAARMASAQDPSEADLSILELQRTEREPIAAEEDLHVIAVDTAQTDALGRLLAQLAAAAP